MSKSLSMLIAALVMGAATSANAAILVRVSGKGSDAAGCGSVAAPCRTMQYAHDQVDAGGYVVALDPADFGGVVVRKSVTIANESAGAALIQSSGAGMDIAGGSAVTVRLRGLRIEGVGMGILTRNTGWLDIADCAFTKGTYGIITGLAPPYAAPHIALSETRFSGTGYAVWGESQALYATDTRILGAVSLFSMVPRAFVFKDSLIEADLASTGTAGVQLADTIGVLRNSTVRNAPIGLDAISTIFLLSGATITGNALAFKQSNAGQPMFQSAGDNIIRGNVDDALGLVTPAALH